MPVFAQMEIEFLQLQKFKLCEDILFGTAATSNSLRNLVVMRNLVMRIRSGAPTLQPEHQAVSIAPHDPQMMLTWNVSDNLAKFCRYGHPYLMVQLPETQASAART